MDNPMPQEQSANTRYRPWLRRVIRLGGIALIAMAVLASFAWWRGRAASQFGGDWIRYLSIDKTEPVVRYWSAESERGVLIVIRDQIRIIANPYFNRETHEPVTNQEACRIEYGSQEGWKFGSGSDGSGLGYRTWSPSFLGRQGFEWSSNGMGGGSDHRVEWGRSSTYMSFPLWVLIIPGLAVLLIWFARLILLGTDQRDGLCPSCGYDLRASPVRCPECGRPTVEEAKRSESTQ